MIPTYVQKIVQFDQTRILHHLEVNIQIPLIFYCLEFLEFSSQTNIVNKADMRITLNWKSCDFQFKNLN